MRDYRLPRGYAHEQYNDADYKAQGARVAGAACAALMTAVFFLKCYAF